MRGGSRASHAPRVSCRTSSRRTLAAGALALVLLASPARGQVAVVLSGGGSRGLAHAGALVGLEQRGMQADLVVGTSMGAIIGALYAAGVAPDSIWSLTRRVDWLELFSMPTLYIGPDARPRRPMVDMGVYVDRDRYSEGLIPDWRVNRLLATELFDAGARAGGNFDNMPRRFRAIAVDLRTGFAVALGRGNLARAARASMAVPGVFAPVLLNGQTLVDGGLADYLPVRQAKDAGARRTVAVDVLRPPDSMRGLTPFEVALRGLRITLRNARTDTTPADITITPAIDPNLFAMVFVRDPLYLLEAGRTAALEQAPEFHNARMPSPAPAPTTFGAVVIEVNDTSLLPFVNRVFSPLKDQRYDPAAVTAAIARIYTSGFFAGVWPGMEQRGGRDALTVRVEARPPTLASGAAGFDSDRGFRAWAGLRQRFAGTSEAQLSLSASAIETQAALSIRHALPAQPAVSLQTGVFAGEYDQRLFEADGIAEHSVQRSGAWLGLAWRPLDTATDVNVAVRAEHVHDAALRGFAAGPSLRIGGRSRGAEIVGEVPRLEADWRFGDVPWHGVMATGSLAAGRRGRVMGALVGQVAAASAGTPADAQLALGDRHDMPGLRWGEARDRASVLGGADIALATPLESHVRLRIRAGAAAPTLGKLDAARWFAGVETGVLWWTPFGRVAVDVGGNTHSRLLFSVDVGPRF